MEIGEYRPALVLSRREYDRKIGLLICCPISTSIRGGATAVPISNIEKPSVIVTSLVQTLSWKERKVEKIVTADPKSFRETVLKLLPLSGATEVLEEMM